jgi:chlorophyll synthase
MLGGAVPRWEVLALAALYSLGAHGIMTLNDFKAIEGDRQSGVRSLPVQLGPDRAARLAGWTIVAPQFVVVALLLWWGRPWHALAIALLITQQLRMLPVFFRQPVEKAFWYSGMGVPFSVLGMMVCAHAVRGLEALR